MKITNALVLAAVLAAGCAMPKGSETNKDAKGAYAQVNGIKMH
jgi:hypothetical protein